MTPAALLITSWSAGTNLKAEDESWQGILMSRGYMLTVSLSTPKAL